MTTLTVIVAIMAICTSGANASRILAVIPTPSFSHQVLYRPLWRALAERGHQLTLITSDPMRNASLTTLREIDVSAAYDFRSITRLHWDCTTLDKLTALTKIIDFYYETTRMVYSHDEVRDLFKGNRKEGDYDLLMLECVFTSVFAFIKRYPNTPVICLSSIAAADAFHEALGNPVHPVLYPFHVLPFTEGMNFIQRVISVLSATAFHLYTHQIIMPELNRIMADVLGCSDPMEDMAASMERIDMFFTNANPLLSSVRPVAPATISIAGGLHEAPPQTLPQSLQQFLDGAPSSVIYFSLGSNVKSAEIAPAVRETIMETFRQLPELRILWKFEADHLPNQPSNVMIAKWLPQQDVLRHPKLRLFITQAGLQSLEEALYARVPMVALPLCADQESNALRLETKGLGLSLNIYTLTVEGFKSAILEVLENEAYRNSVRKWADILQDEPMGPVERAVWWTEYVLRHNGAQHLKGPRIPTWQYYYLDVFAFFGVVGLLTAWILKQICRIVYYKCVRSAKIKNE